MNDRISRRSTACKGEIGRAVHAAANITCRRGSRATWALRVVATCRPRRRPPEREAIDIGVRATIVGLLASRDITVLEIDFDNPPEWPDHCPPQATFVHYEQVTIPAQAAA